jgi:energy-coupling factor transport system permease protein
MKNPISWCCWATAALAAAFMERNPFLQVLLLLVLMNVWLPYRRGPGLQLRVGLVLAVVPIVFSVALSRFGSHVIVTLPAIPIIGGPWTWEALLFGASSGVALLLTVAVFAILQSTVRSADLVSLLPRPFYRAGTAFALSVAFVPKTVQSFIAIQESRRLRGKRAGWRGAPAVLVPLLLTALEQALQYGESLDARGYGNRRRSRYRPIRWSIADTVAALAAALALLLMVVIPLTTYDPYSRLLPSAPPVTGILAVVLLAIPAIVISFTRGSHATDQA